MASLKASRGSMAGLRARWRRLREAEPGNRFQRQYRENRGSRKSGPGRPGAFAAAIGLLALGVLLLFVPGPGLLLIGAGAAILAGQSLPMARLLDWLELRIRGALQRIRG